MNSSSTIEEQGHILGREVAVPTAYRWDINLYRALAVIAVLLFHLDISGFGRGFLGVDLFFLISGYVITQSLERRRGARFSAKDFFLGRIYRILPMVGFTVFITLALGTIFLAPTDLIKAAESALATLFSVANIYFWTTIDYFDPASAAKPLLHMWSLGAEEQFYLVFPLIFIAFASLAKRRIAIAVAFALITALSIGFAISGTVSDSSLFYLLPFRMNQFLAGSLAFYVVNASRPGALTRKTIWIVLSAALLAVSFWLDLPEEYRLSVIFTFAAMPLFVINLSRFASAGVFKPLHHIADWSYSIYVLHWPIIAFWIVARGDLGWAGALICGTLTIGLAWLAYRFIERPYQKRRRMRGSWRDALKTVIAPMLLIAAIATGLILSRGLAFRIGEDLTQPFEELEKQRAAYLTVPQKNTIEASEFSTGKISVVIIGDSFAGGMYRFVRGIPGVEVHFGASTSYFCRALTIPKDPKIAKHAERCEKNWMFIDRDFSKADVIFIADSSASFGVHDEIDEAGYEAVFKRFRDNGFKGRFVLSGIRPIYRSAPYQTAYAAKTLDGLREGVAKDIILDPETMNVLSERMSKWAGTQGVTLLPLFPYLCDMETCAVTNADNEIIYLDTSHFSDAAASLVVDAIEDVLVRKSVPLTTIASDTFGGDVSNFSDAEIAAIPDKHNAIKLALLRSDTESAVRLSDAYLDEMEGENIGALVTKLFNEFSDTPTRQATLLVAERQLLRSEDFSARYIAGLSHYQGIIVTREDTKVVQLWDHPSMKTVGAVQYRLSEIYGNPESSVYNPNTAAQKLTASQKLGFQPE